MERPAHMKVRSSSFISGGNLRPLLTPSVGWRVAPSSEVLAGLSLNSG